MATIREQPFAEDSVKNASKLGRRGVREGHHWSASTNRDKASISGANGNKAGRRIVVGEAANVAFENQPQKDDDPMTTTTARIGLSLSAALVSLGLAFAPAVFAQDKMGKDDGMKKESMSKDAMKKDDAMTKKDGMKHDGMMKDGMKKN